MKKPQRKIPSDDEITQQEQAIINPINTTFRAWLKHQSLPHDPENHLSLRQYLATCFVKINNLSEQEKERLFNEPLNQLNQFNQK